MVPATCSAAAEPGTTPTTAGTSSPPNDVVVIDNCWAFSNGKTVSGKNNPQGDGNGFKLGGKPDRPRAGRRGPQGDPLLGVRESLLRIRAQQQPQQAQLSGAALEPERTPLRSHVLTDVTMTMTGAQAKAAARNADGSLPGDPVARWGAGHIQVPTTGASVQPDRLGVVILMSFAISEGIEWSA